MVVVLSQASRQQHSRDNKVDKGAKGPQRQGLDPCNRLGKQGHAGKI